MQKSVWHQTKDRISPWDWLGTNKFEIKKLLKEISIHSKSKYLGYYSKNRILPALSKVLCNTKDYAFGHSSRKTFLILIMTYHAHKSSSSFSANEFSIFREPLCLPYDAATLYRFIYETICQGDFRGGVLEFSPRPVVLF